MKYLTAMAKGLSQLVERKALYLVDPSQSVAIRLPHTSKITFTTKAENWDKGKIYVPPGAKIVSARNEAEAFTLVEQMLYPNKTIAAECTA